MGCDCGKCLEQEQNDKRQRKVLWAVLAINAAFFIIEITFGIVSHSMGLIADSLDMMAEERFVRSIFGTDYAEYAAKTRRYL